MSARRIVILVLAAAAAAADARAQARAGGETRVNTLTLGEQDVATLGRDRAGNFVIAWHDAQTTNVRAQRFDRAGVRLGAELVVNTLPGGNANLPAVAVDPGGGFVVAWQESPEPGGAAEGIRAALFDAAGHRRGPELAVNSYTTGRQVEPMAAMGADGTFVVAWISTDGSGYGVFAQRFAPDGRRAGQEFRVNTSTAGTQFFPALAVRDDGAFIVTWTDTDASSHLVRAQRYGAGGEALGGEFQVSAFTTGYQLASSPSFAPDRSFVVAFGSSGRDGSLGAQLARRFDALGRPLGVEFQVSQQTVDLQAYGWVAHDLLGNFVIEWNDFRGDGDVAVKARRFTADGTPRGPEFRVNTYTTGNQWASTKAPPMATDPNGNLVVTWVSPQEGNGNEAYAQRFGGLHPQALAVDRSHNGVLEPGETAVLEPAWFNASGVFQDLGGVLSGFSGPPGPAYAITDATASYQAATNTSAFCFGCYAVTVSDPSPRPLPHWDATVDETLTPDAEGQVQRWTLHVGRSFDDVPSSSPFYRFVEALLHHGVTGGCAPGLYCPASPTTRAQMAVFALVAREGVGYAPPFCTTPRFTDVPASDPFCRWIEELARRGIVSGCGGGAYCPHDPVTRAQMAVFMLRTLDGALDPPSCAAPGLFGDVPPASPFCRWIEELARRGVVTGCGDGRYCPEDPVLRDQMGVFIGATFGLTLYGP